MTDSFLDEHQKAGRAQEGKDMRDYISIEEAINSVHQSGDREVLAEYKAMKEEDMPTAVMSTYCTDCRAIVSPGMGKGRRGKPRTVCGECNSVKVSSGTEKALRSHYRLDK